LKIQSIVQYPVKYNIIKEGWAAGSQYHSYYFWPSETTSIIIEVQTSNGLIGVGEAAVEHWYYGNTLEHNSKTLELYEERIKGEDPENLARIHRLADSVIGRGAPSSTSSKDALDTALLDIAGQAHSEPIYNLLGGAYQTSFELMTNLYLDTADAMAQKAMESVKDGYTGLKIKCGMEVEEKGYSLKNIYKDLAKLVKTLEVVPSTIQIDGDCNQSWGSAHRAISLIKANNLERYANLGIEQPLGYLDLQGASKIGKATSVPVVLDESIFSPEMLIEVIRNGAADRIVVKPSRVGGLTESKKLITIAEAASINVCLDNSPCSKIGMTAMCHAAALVKEPYPACADLHTWLKEDPVKKGGLTVEDGLAKISSAPGLGIELDYDVLEKIKVRSQSINR
jgi:L-alanine-DL-glutamate epimerase-like enolase superfamily enzyme